MPFEISEHYNCKISNITTNLDRMTPTWHRVSESPWAAKAAKCAGYGRPLIRCAISDDMPLYFPRTEHIKRPEDLKELPKQNFSATASIQASLLLPGAKSTLAPKPVHGNRIKKLIHGNQVLAEPYKTPRDNATFYNWTYRESARDSGRETSRESARLSSRGSSRSRPKSSQNSPKLYPSSSRIASAKSTGRSNIGSSNSRSKLYSR